MVPERDGVGHAQPGRQRPDNCGVRSSAGPDPAAEQGGRVTANLQEHCLPVGETVGAVRSTS